MSRVVEKGSKHYVSFGAAREEFRVSVECAAPPFSLPVSFAVVAVCREGQRFRFKPEIEAWCEENIGPVAVVLVASGNAKPLSKVQDRQKAIGMGATPHAAFASEADLMVWKLRWGDR